MTGVLRTGFKAEAERTSLLLRAELGLMAGDRLDCRDLATLLGIPVLALRELREEVVRADSIKQLARMDAGFSALTVCAGTRRLIVYNQRHPPGRRASSLAHILLEHPPTPALDGSRQRLWDPAIEAEADWQAGALLVPRDGAAAGVRRERGLANGEKHFGVSRALFMWRVYQTGVARQFGLRSLRAGGVQMLRS